MKQKNKPIKVVYISNPMKVKTSVSEFRTLVQELTGKDAEMQPDPSRYCWEGDSSGYKILVSDEDCVKENGHYENDNTLVIGSEVEVNDVEVENCGEVSSSMDYFEAFDDDVFTPQMIENISTFLPDSVFCHL
ncbi:hypothetical protein TanjilG_06098 [Lupinus angustifolius]|uniref:VQ domain-containing protein n=1 Tax=Lupinus angustifolius TaxID=3871 RepID=A0A4P1RJU3_LUPAN|nr:hypothetical protein TanjilG_06098 [Lupinus angustifolius]